MKLYWLWCVNEDGETESNGYFLFKENAEEEKFKLEKEVINIKKKFGISNGIYLVGIK